MTILNTSALMMFARKHRHATTPLNRWIDLTLASNWRGIVDVRSVFPSADGVAVKQGGRTIIATVFNIKSYRLITVIDFGGAVVTMFECLTHGEYDRNLWKGRL